jgi:CHASE3 domain sensor protein
MTSDCLSPSAFRRLLIRTVVVPPVLLGILALIFLAQILYLLSAARWVNHTNQVISEANVSLTLLVDGETGQRGYLITGESAFLEPWHAAEIKAGLAIDALMVLVADNPAQVERLKILRADQTAWQQYAQKVIDLRRVSGDYGEIALTTEGKRRMDAMRGQIAEFIRVEESLREERTRIARRATWEVVGTSLGLALLLGVSLALLTRRQLLQVSANYQTALYAAEIRAESLRKSAHRLETLHEIDRAILAAESMSELTGAALLGMEHIVPGDAFVVAFGGRQVFSRNRVVEADPALLGATEQDGPRVVPDLKAATRTPLHEHLYQSGHQSCVTIPLDTDGRRFGVLVLADPKPSAFTEEHRQIAHEIARQLAIAFHQAESREQLQRHAEELERRVEERTHELQESLGSVKQLQGLLPICAWCKKVRDDGNYWHQVEHYITAHTDATFTHGICPACLDAVMRDPGAQSS